VFPYSLPLAAVSVLTIIASALITYRHPERRVLAGAVLVLGSSIWLMMQALEMSSDNLSVKFFFYMMRYVGVVTVPGAWLVLAMLISGYERHVNKRNIFALIVIPVLSLLLIFTNESHSLMFKNASLNPADPSLPLVVTFGPAYWVLAVMYSYTLMVVGFVIIVRRIIVTRRSYRVLGAEILLISMVPWALNLVYVLDPSVFMHFEPSSLVISLAGAVLLWRIVELPIMGVLPVAHEKLVDSMNDAIFVLDGQNRIVDANPMAESLFGRSLPEAVGKSIENVWAGWPATRKALDSEAGTRREVMLGDQGGQQIYEVQGSSVEGLLANVPYQLVTLRDITERKRAEEALRESEDRLRRITDSMLDIVVETDLQGICKYASPSNKAIMGYDSKDLVGRSLFDFVHPEDLATVTATIQRAVSTGRLWTGGRFECRYRHADGHYVWLENLANMVYDEKGQMTGGVIGARDITDRKRMEDDLKRYSMQLEQLVAERTRELSASKDYAENLIQTANAMVIGLDNNGNIQVFNQAAEKITGYSRDELHGRNWFEVIVPRDRYPQVWGEFERLTTGGLPRNFENPILSRSGEERYIVWQNNDVRDQGRIVGTISFGIDITERKRMEGELRSTKERLEYVVTSNPAVIYSGKPSADLSDWELTYISENVMNLLGYEAGEFVGQPEFWTNIVHAVDRPSVMRQVPRLWEKGRFTFEYRMRHKDGEYRWIREESNVVHDADGKPVEVNGYWTDITAQKQAELALAESERKYRQLIETAQEGLFTYDTNGMVTFVNPFMSIILGYAPGEMIGKNLLAFVDEEDVNRVKAGMERRRRGFAETYEVRLIRKDGSRIYTSVTVSPIMGEGREFAGGLALLSDITERKRLEAQLAESERLAAIGETTTMVGHDLRNPLQAMTNTLYLVKRLATSEKAKDKREAVGLVSGLNDTIQYMDKIVSDLQDYARPVGADRVETSLPDLIKATVSNVKIPGNVDVAVDVGDELSNVKLDPALFRRVLTNLILNAVQAMPKGGKLTITGSRGVESFTVAVQDTGVGIAPENLEKVFKPFFTTKAQGQGLGLAVCKRLTEAQGGTVEVASRVGKGSTFTLRIPINRTPTAT